MTLDTRKREILVETFSFYSLIVYLCAGAIWYLIVLDVIQWIIKLSQTNKTNDDGNTSSVPTGFIQSVQCAPVDFVSTSDSLASLTHSVPLCVQATNNQNDDEKILWTRALLFAIEAILRRQSTRRLIFCSLSLSLSFGSEGAIIRVNKNTIFDGKKGSRTIWSH